MITWIQPLLIVAVLLLLVYLLRSRSTAQAKAWVKLGFVVFVVAGIYAILRPNDTTTLAHWLGLRPWHRPHALRADYRVRIHHPEHVSALQGPRAALLTADQGGRATRCRAPSGDIAPELAPEEVNSPSDPVR